MKPSINWPGRLYLTLPTVQTWFLLVWNAQGALRGTTFYDNDKVKENVLKWLRHQYRDFFPDFLVRGGSSVLMLLGIMLKNIKIVKPIK